MCAMLEGSDRSLSSVSLAGDHEKHGEGMNDSKRKLMTRFGHMFEKVQQSMILLCPMCVCMQMKLHNGRQPFRRTEALLCEWTNRSSTRLRSHTANKCRIVPSPHLCWHERPHPRKEGGGHFRAVQGYSPVVAVGHFRCLPVEAPLEAPIFPESHPGRALARAQQAVDAVSAHQAGRC